MRLTEFARRRRHFMEEIGADSIAVVPSATVKSRNRDNTYPFRQDSDFLYLTGFPEPDAVAVFMPRRRQGAFILFCRDRDPDRERWEGHRAGPAGAVEHYGADDAFPITDIHEILPGLLESRDRVVHAMGAQHDFDQQLLGWLNGLNARRQAGHAPRELVMLDPVLHEARLFKSRAELAAMRQSARIAVQAHQRGMQCCRPGMFEYELEAEYRYEFNRNAAPCSYPPIVAGGTNACILHYVDNDQVLMDGDLVLVDAGCEYETYASDITRTFPVNGRFTEAQKALYEVVLTANRAAIAAVKPGNHWNDPHDAAVREIVRGLKRLGLLDGRLPDLIKTEAYRPYFMHKTGHWLGMDVHDVGDYRVDDMWRLLEPGMVLTIEPGIYIPHDDTTLDECFRGVGIRIEDDVAVTRDGAELLTDGLPATVEEVEACMGAGQ